MSEDIVYLGDGLYASYDGYQFKLMANSPTEPTDTVYLPWEVVDSFADYVARIDIKRESDNDGDESS